MTASSLFLRTVVAVLALAATVGQLAYLDALTWHLVTPGLSSGADARASVVTAAVAHAVLSVTSASLAAVMVLRGRAGTQGTGPLALAVGAWSYLLAYPGIVVLLRPDPGVLRTAFESHFLLVEAVGLGGLLRFTSTFPAPLSLPAAPTTGGAAWLAALVRPLRAVLLRPGVIWSTVLLLPVALVGITAASGTPTGDAGLHPLMDVFRVTVAAAVVLNLRDGWSQAGAQARERMSWLTAGLSALLAAVLLVIGGNILFSATGWPDPPFTWRPILLDLGVLGFVAGLAATQLAPPRTSAVRTTRRVALGTALLMTTLLAATMLETLLSSGIFGPVALPAGLGAAMAAAAMGSVSGPVLRFYDRLLDQWPGFEVADQAID